MPDYGSSSPPSFADVLEQPGIGCSAHSCWEDSPGYVESGPFPPEFRKVRLTYTLLHLLRRLSASPEHFTRLFPIQKPACPFLTQPFASGRHGLRHSSSWFSAITVTWSYNLELSPPRCIGPRPGLALCLEHSQPAQHTTQGERKSCPVSPDHSAGAHILCRHIPHRQHENI